MWRFLVASVVVTSIFYILGCTLGYICMRKGGYVVEKRAVVV